MLYLYSELVLETLSERYFADSLPSDWTCEKPSNDYGIDLRVDIFEDGFARGLELLVQLKSSDTASNGPTEKIRLNVSTYNYLWDKLQVVMLVKYVQEVNEAYWLLLREVPEPNQEQDTFTIHIPKQNTLSTINWDNIQELVRQVTYGKLQSWRTRNNRL
jgi:hypothetical protein